MSKNDSNTEVDKLYERIQNALANQTTELKQSIQQSKEELTEEIKELKIKLSLLEERCSLAENRCVQLERKVRKNNIIIFGLDAANKITLLPDTLETLNRLLQLNIQENEINNIYRIGNRQNTAPLILEFTSFLKKQAILRNATKLKGTHIYIANDLCPEDRKEYKILREHLKLAKSKNAAAYIKGNKLIINNETYSATQLNRQTSLEEEEEVEESRPTSAPSTPNAISRRTQLMDEFGPDIENRHQEQEPTPPNQGNKITLTLKKRHNPIAERASSRLHGKQNK